MTITDSGRVEVDEETLARGRELTVGGRMPSKREMQKHLGKAWPTVNAVLTRLGDEAQQETERRRQGARRAIRRLSSRKRSGSVRPVRSERQRTVNEIAVPVSPAPVLEPAPEPIREAVEKHPEPVPVAVNAARPDRRIVTWPVLVVAAGAFVAIWAGWVALGKLTGFGKVNLLPGFWSGWTVDTAITLPLGMEAYAAYAFYVWLHPRAPRRARLFAAWSSLGAVALGMGGQTAYHLMTAAHMTAAPWQITTVVSCLPVAVFGLAAALVHLVRAGDDDKEQH
jgi:hypothetical protein